jgi:hypothetical protein
MIDHLKSGLPEFGGRAGHTRCFLHTTNLIAKSLIREFDAKKSNKSSGGGIDINEANESESSSEELVLPDEDDNGDMAENSVDNDDGLIHLTAEMEPTERAEHEERIQPIKLVLAKVLIRFSSYLCLILLSQIRKLAFKIIHSTTILLPAWRETLKDLKLACRNMPRDVQTRWNSTYDMLAFAIEYRRALDSMTQRRDLGLRAYELDPEEWRLAQQLADVLKVQINTYKCLEPRACRDESTCAITYFNGSFGLLSL